MVTCGRLVRDAVKDVRKTSGGARGGARTHVRDTCRIRADLADGLPPASPLLSFNSAVENTHVSSPPGTLDGADTAEKRHKKIIYESTAVQRHRMASQTFGGDP